MDRPLVSIVIPTYNRPDRLPRAIQSVLEQTYAPIEIIVVNDCGSGVEAIIESMNSTKTIHYCRHGANKGLAGARNTGIRYATGKYIGYLDDDDMLYPDHVATLVEFLESNQCEVAYTDSREAHQLQENGNYRTVNYFLRYSVDFDYEGILVQNFVPVLCFLHARECFSKVEPFDESLSAHEDWDFWIRLSRQYRMHHIPTVTSEYSQVLNANNQNMSRNIARMYKTAARVHEKNAQWVQDRPDLKLRQQQFAEAMRSNWEIQARAEFNQFVEPLVKFMEAKDTAAALKWFDEHADKFRNGLPEIQPEFAQIEDMMKRVRK